MKKPPVGGCFCGNFAPGEGWIPLANQGHPTEMEMRRTSVSRFAGWLRVNTLKRMAIAELLGRGSGLLLGGLLLDETSLLERCLVLGDEILAIAVGAVALLLRRLGSGPLRLGGGLLRLGCLLGCIGGLFRSCGSGCRSGGGRSLGLFRCLLGFLVGGGLLGLFCPLRIPATLDRLVREDETLGLPQEVQDFREQCREHHPVILIPCESRQTQVQLDHRVLVSLQENLSALDHESIGRLLERAPLRRVRRLNRREIHANALFVAALFTTHRLDVDVEQPIVVIVMLGQTSANAKPSELELHPHARAPANVRQRVRSIVTSGPLTDTKTF